MHLVIISKKKIKGRFSDAVKQMKQLKEVGKIPACTNFISGPSFSADIAATFVQGVHGPKELHVYIIDFEIEN
ncbi:LUD domain-containing protein [Bacillus sp. FJAT-47783]|uniref:LUD domain-containing protein n=1 Tax=Bacillus sp. FJAT-47783 TaxID=2922712 RepID=UPI001FAC1B48|nr:LUD domain-containing protein [Bacillus sp. FJAT-47783]